MLGSSSHAEVPARIIQSGAVVKLVQVQVLPSGNRTADARQHADSPLFGRHVPASCSARGSALHPSFKSAPHRLPGCSQRSRRLPCTL